MLTSEQLSCFVTTVEQGSFSAAGRKLGKAQSAVSQQIINMEIDSGTVLFDRSGRTPVLTPAGKQLLPYARAVLAQHLRLELQLSALQHNEPAKLTLALDEGIPLNGLLPVLQTLTAQFPHLALETLSSASADIIDMVAEARVDCGVIFSGLHYPAMVDFASLGCVAFDIYISPNHALAHTPSLHADMLRLHRQLVIGARNQATCEFNYPHSPDVWHGDNYYLLGEMTQAGLGWAMLPCHIAAPAVAQGQLIRLPVALDHLGWQANVDLISHQRMAANPVCQFLRRHLSTLLPQNEGKTDNSNS
ncbi:transcriptional regulator [Shewanella sp. NFH-SH190041]|uniref:LysR family transcriptional regulator n=1 Tax=Shewanella sp. NFH-SH190041 TaxID=2950245 RepID=UPI0021C36EED|nr:LysR family transcriptional regulator [Shewanella sp. NFH-SH190041]BDM65268.1 transcriptional regulator [Shewanella sp. NFH-SH190041]